MQIILNALIRLFHHLPIKSGLTTLSFNPIINRLLSRVPKVAVATLRDGSSIEVTTSDYHGRILYLFGTNDPKVELTANSLLGAGDVFLDIGANYSSIGLSASHVVGSEGMVHLFEPQKVLGDRVQAVIDNGRHMNVRLHRIGLMDRDATLILKSPSHHSGMATFAANNGSRAFENVEECQVREIGSYVGPLIANRTFGAKVDIEGAELAVMSWLLVQPNLRFVIFEAAANQRSLYEAVRTAKLILYGLKRDPLRLRLVRVDEFAEMSLFHDLVAIRIRDNYPAPAQVHPRFFRPDSPHK